MERRSGGEIIRRNGKRKILWLEDLIGDLSVFVKKAALIRHERPTVSTVAFENDTATLLHQNIVSGTEDLFIGAIHLDPDNDYTINYTTGIVTFANGAQPLDDEVEDLLANYMVVLL